MIRLRWCLTGLLPLAFSAAALAQTTVGTGFTYQGHLRRTAPAPIGQGFPMDSADLRFSLWDDETAGNQIGSEVQLLNVPVENGLFTVTLDFGEQIFDGRARWLRVAVRAPHDPDNTTFYAIMNPRQRINAAPYALALPGLYTRPAVTPNLIGGHQSNAVTDGVIGGTIGGGGGSSTSNLVTDNHGTVAGGNQNRAGNDTGTTNDALEATVGGGFNNRATASRATVGGGLSNQATGSAATVGGGNGNNAGGANATIPGGNSNSAAGDYSFAAGRRAKANHAGAFVWADSTVADFLSTAANQFLIRAGGGVGINTAAPASDLSVAGDADISGKLGVGTDSPFARLDVLQSATAATAISGVISSNSGNAGYFGASHADNPETALLAIHAGSGKSFLAYNYGTGKAAEITVDNPASSAHALEVNNSGTGFGINVAAQGVGVYATAAGSIATGVTGIAATVGVSGTASASTGPSWGGYFQNASPEGAGVEGAAGSATGEAHGVSGRTMSPSGAGVKGVNLATTGSSTGVRGEGGTYGVVGTASGVGVLGVSTEESGGIGMFGWGQGQTGGIGVMGQTGSDDGTAVYGIAFDQATYAVRGLATSAGFAGYFEGRGYFEANLGVGVETAVSRLDVRDQAANTNVMNISRDADSTSASDLLQMVMGAGSSDASQFIECERGSDIKFRVWGDGDVTMDGLLTSPADFAEMIRVTTGSASVEPGDVVVIDPANPRAVVRSGSARSTLVAGIYSTRPGLLGSEHNWDDVARSLGFDPMSDAAERNPKPMELGKMIDEVPVAVVGIVPCKVSAENGPIRPGDLLVTSTTAGHAMRDEQPKTGTVVGKALGSLESGTGVIRVLVSLQ